jgi:hypothetical protein
LEPSAFRTAPSMQRLGDLFVSPIQPPVVVLLNHRVDGGFRGSALNLARQ